MTMDLKDKAAGCLIGLAIGDAFGDAARDAENQFLYGITLDFPEKATGSTDDTEFALLTAEILLQSGGNPTREHVLQAWKKHVIIQDELKRGGASEREAANNIRKGILAPDSGKFNAYSNSDGAAMRSAPAGIVAAGNPQKAMTLAETDAEISHFADGIWGAQAVAAAVSKAMMSASVDEILHTAFTCAPKGSWFLHGLTRAFDLLEKFDYQLAEAWMPLHQELRSEYKAAVPEAVTSALAVFRLTNGDFVSGIRYAGNFGRDSDTIGAIVGALSGALHGLKAIPQNWVEKVRQPNGTCLQFTKGRDMIDIAHRLAELME
jgi:ADP-ribosylglycohydrolase